MSNHRKNRAKKHLQLVLHDFLDVIDYLQQQETSNTIQGIKNAKVILIGLVSDLQTHYPHLIRRSINQKTEVCILKKMIQLYQVHLPVKSNNCTFQTIIARFTKTYDNMLDLVDGLQDSDWDLPLLTTYKNYRRLTIEDAFCLLIPSVVESQFLEIIRVIESSNPSVS